MAQVLLVDRAHHVGVNGVKVIVAVAARHLVQPLDDLREGSGLTGQLLAQVRREKAGIVDLVELAERGTEG